ncbi:MAG TPA: VOC family protein [Opitutaceae bacterium]
MKHVQKSGTAGAGMVSAPRTGRAMRRREVCDPGNRAHTGAMISRLDHVALTCRDVQVSAAWYSATLGMHVEFPGAWEGNPVFLTIGTARLALFHARAPETVVTRPALRVDHFALLAAKYDDFEAVRERLSSRGIPAEFQDHELSHSVYIKDPDGHVVEITTYDVAGR